MLLHCGGGDFISSLKNTKNAISPYFFTLLSASVERFGVSSMRDFYVVKAEMNPAAGSLSRALL